MNSSILQSNAGLFTPENLQNILEKKCIFHPSFPCEFLDLTGETKTHRICILCIQQQSIPVERFLSIRELYEDSSKVFQTYPALNDSKLLSHRIQNVQLQLDLAIKQINSFFDDCKENFEKALQIAKDQAQKIILTLSQSKENCIKTYHDIAEINILKQLISSSDNQADTDLHVFLKNKWDKSDNYSAMIQNAADQFEAAHSKINLSSASQEAEKITKMIQELSLFTEKQSKISNNHNDQNVLPKVKNQIESSDNGQLSQSILQNALLKPSKLPDSSMEDIKLTRYTSVSLEMTLLNNDKKYSQSYLDCILNPDKKYVFQIDIQQNSGNYTPVLMFGLIPYKLRETHFLGKFQMSYCDCADTWGISKMIKGSQLHSGCKPNIKRSFLMQIHINEKILKVASMPDFSSIAEVSDITRLDGSEEYVLGLYMQYPKDTIKLVSADIVDEFDNRMKV